MNPEFVRSLSFSARGILTPLCSVIGGIASHEALKGVTEKYIPINQWFYISAMELQSQNSDSLRESKLDALSLCCHGSLLRSLAESRLFMVGCGAIGCELLKILGLLGCAASGNGKIIITDNDLIEKSNLNRQFLFRPCHVQKSKSKVAAESICKLFPKMVVESHEQKFCKESENFFTDEFFHSIDVVLNALDNVEARLYVDR